MRLRTHRATQLQAEQAASELTAGELPPPLTVRVRMVAQSLLVYKINVAHNLVFLKGTIPGSRGSFVRLSDAKLKPFLSKKGCRTPPPFPTFLPGDPIDDADAEELVVPKRDDDPLVM